MEDDWLTWAKQLQAIAATGIHFTEDAYDKERYEQIVDIANNMLATLGSVPLNRIEGLISDFTQGYVTPRIDVRGAVLKDDKVLLVQEATDELWTLPGGYAEVGLSPADNVVKEILEEASINVTATSLYSVRHKAKHDYDPDVRDFYKMFFLCEQSDECSARPGPETLDVGFFKLSQLPTLSKGRVIRADIEAAFEAVSARSRRSELPATFD